MDLKKQDFFWVMATLGLMFGALVAGLKLGAWEDAKGAVAAAGTVERRIHLTVDTRWDTDHRRKFECREVP